MSKKSLNSLQKYYNTDNFFNDIIEAFNNEDNDKCKHLYDEMKIQHQKEFLCYSVKILKERKFIKLINIIM